MATKDQTPQHSSEYKHEVTNTLRRMTKVPGWIYIVGQVLLCGALITFAIVREILRYAPVLLLLVVAFLLFLGIPIAYGCHLEFLDREQRVRPTKGALGKKGNEGH